MARAVEDLAHMLQAIAGHDSKDPTSSSAGGRIRECCVKMRRGWSLAFRAITSTSVPRTESIVLKLVDRAIEELKSLGARVEEVKVPTLRVATIANAVIYYNEFWAAHKSDAAWCSRMARRSGGHASTWDS